ncbi:(2Fe-2S)-binding protein [Paraburkholderia strydomiana]
MKDDSIPTSSGVKMSRRTLFKTTLAATTTATIGAIPGVQAREQHGREETDVERHSVSVSFTLNDVRHDVVVRPDVTLLDLLREQLQLTGTKKGCNRGECGACTVLLNKRRVNACFVLAASLDGHTVTTIEGLSDGDALHPVQQAFIACDAFQCGFCTSGQIMSAVGCISEGHTRSNAEIREWMSGNLCRCSAYPQIALAVETAAKKMAEGNHGTV